MIDYTPYRVLLKNRNLKQQELINKGIINSRIANAIKHDKSITLDTLDKICEQLDCEYEEIVRRKRESE